MGSSMALNLRAAGYDIVVNDIRREAGAAHLNAGASWGDSARKVAEAADVVFTSLPGPREVEEVALAEDGLLAGMRRETAWFDLSTNSPTVVRRLHERFAAKGIAMLDSPVSGGPAGAKSRKLALWVSGEKAVFDRQKRADAIGDQAMYVGPISTGTVAKLVHNTRATRSWLRSPKCSRWESKPESSPSRCGKRCARGRSAAGEPSTGSPSSFCPAYSIRLRSR
jgi:3-hydroxyisobutyrate dehydrogenase